MKITSAWLGLGLALLFASPAHAYLPIPLSVEELNRQADLVIRGTVLEKTCRRDAEGRIYTEVVLQVTETWRGHVGGERITVVQGGGILGNRAETAIGQVDYALKEDVVAFLVRNVRGEPVTVAMAQGKFHLERVGSLGTTLATNPFHKGETQVKSRRVVSGPGLTLEELRRRVKEAGR